MLFRCRSCTVWALFTVALLCLFRLSPARAASLPEGGYSIHVWQTEEGLPQNTVTTITQTRDGYIWIGTYGGLARFDGERFQNFDAVNTPYLQDSRIVSLYEDKEGVLWIGHDSGHVTRYRNGRFEPFNSEVKSVMGKVGAIGEDESGTLWLLRENGLLESAKDKHLLRPPNYRNPPHKVEFTSNAAGKLWIAEDGDVAQLSNGKLEALDFGPAHYSGYALGIGAAADGGVWVVMDRQIRKWSGDRWTENRGPYPWEGASVTSVLEMRDGCVAIGTIDQGLYLIFGDGRTLHFDHSNGLPQNWVRFLYEDREGDLWVGAGTGGLAAVRPTAFTVLNPPDQWQGRTVLSVTSAKDGALWIGAEGAGLYRYFRGEWSHFGEEHGLRNLFVWSVAEDPSGRIWAGTWGDGIYRFENGQLLRPAEFESLNAPIFAFQFNPDNQGMWIGTGLGLLHVKEGVQTWPFTRPDGGAVHVCTVVRDRDGAIWFGQHERGLGRLKKGKLSQFRKSDGLSSDSVQSLLPDEDGTLWIGTADGGLNRLKNGRFSTIGMNQGLASNVICHIADDGRGYLWLSTHHGILRIAKSELHRCADGLSPTVVSQVYDRNDGLPTIEYSGGMQAAGCQAADGRLWFTSSKGLVGVDPAKIRLNPLPPPVTIESLRIDGHVVETNGATPAGLRLPPDHQRLEFKFTALSLIAPSKVMFKYRLENLDTDWSDTSPKRTAFYSHLPAGTYRFQVVASNNDGVWNEEGASLTFTVLPFYWQTWWFRGLVVLVVLAAVAFAVRHETQRRMQRQLEQLEREGAIERERARIAQDIHDDIGASLTRITMLSQSISPESSPPKESAVVLQRIYATAREVTRALDEIVWAVDPRHDTLDSLVCYMGKFAQDLLGSAGVRCRLDLPVALPAWPLTTDTRHNLFLAFKEALNNALKHAAATEIQVSLTLRLHAFVLTVKDNGRGIEEAKRAATNRDRIANGNGLGNLHRRLAQIGGRCEIMSEAGKGTSVSFIVEVPPVPYASPPPTRRKETPIL